MSGDSQGTRSWSHLAIRIGWAAIVVALWGATSGPIHFAANVIVTWAGTWALYVALAGSRLAALRRLALLHGTLGLTLLVLEVPALLELMDYRVVFQTPILAPWKNPAFVRDPDLIYRRPPHARLTGSFNGGDFTFLFDAPEAETHEYDNRYDRNGFRNLEDLEQADIAVIGDSFVECAYLADADSLTGRLAAETGATVANLGLIGYGPREELVILERYALPLKPKVVVWLFFDGNDLGNIVRYDEVHPRLDEEYAQYDSFIPRSFSKNAFQLLHRLAGNVRPSGRPQSGLAPLSDGRTERIYFLYVGDALEPSARPALPKLEAIFERASEMSRAAGVRFVVAFAPRKFRVYHDIASMAPELGDQPIDATPDVIERMVAALGEDVAFVDLTEPLRVEAAAGRRPYFVADSHWNAHGSRIAAQEIARALR